MIENIKYLGFDDDFNAELMDTLGHDIVLNLACNYETVKQNIDSLESFGIKDIKKLLLNKVDLFFTNNEELIKKFGKYNIPVVVNLINRDYEIVDELF